MILGLFILGAPLLVNFCGTSTRVHDLRLTDKLALLHRFPYSFRRGTVEERPREDGGEAHYNDTKSRKLDYNQAQELKVERQAKFMSDGNKKAFGRV